MSSAQQKSDAPGEQRSIAVLLHPTRPEAVDAAVEFTAAMSGKGVRCQFAPDRIDEIRARLPEAELGVLTIPDELDAELVVALGGDGTLLASAEWALATDIPLLGVNLGHVGFLAELESYEISGLAELVHRHDYAVEERLTLAVEVFDPEHRPQWSSFAVNEVSMEKLSREKMIDVMASVDRAALSRWSTDGVLVSTPSGSTAYAFSAGGPVMWPDVKAILLVPVSAHALFTGPLVLSQNSRVDLDLAETSKPGAVVLCDGRRSVDVAPGGSMVVTRRRTGLKLARLSQQPFTERLVRKFALPVNGWRPR